LLTVEQQFNPALAIASADKSKENISLRIPVAKRKSELPNPQPLAVFNTCQVFFVSIEINTEKQGLLISFYFKFLFNIAIAYNQYLLKNEK